MNMILIIIIAFVTGMLVSYTSLPYRAHRMLPAFYPKPIPRDAPDQSKIAELEASELGIGRAIAGLSGYTWKVYGYGVDKLYIELCNPDGYAVQIEHPSKNTDGTMHKRRPGEKVRPRTEKELNYVVHAVMREMVDKELEKVRSQSVVNNIIEKYNGKSVNQDI